MRTRRLPVMSGGDVEDLGPFTDLTGKKNTLTNFMLCLFFPIDRSKQTYFLRKLFLEPSVLVSAFSKITFAYLISPHQDVRVCLSTRY
ncbi:unnamed protein product [Protopolystoma xenopodis]|uniref:Uncharacterized protein n=1 Tax=Protopolystoma xenopodis TaxID=117903 RepID=A0A448X7C5_9PLAT|nr:unnamed protein product [Protopolystoma xenopodis]